MHVQHIARFRVPGPFRGYGGFGAIPTDANTATAYALIQAVDAGQDPSSFLSAIDATTRGTVCQRAIDILNLPACTAGMDSSAGTCLDQTGLTNPTATLKSKISAACSAQGVSVTGAGMSTTTWLAIGGVAALGAWLILK